jgi:hypothetical protein
VAVEGEYMSLFGNKFLFGRGDLSIGDVELAKSQDSMRDRSYLCPVFVVRVFASARVINAVKW